MNMESNNGDLEAKQSNDGGLVVKHWWPQSYTMVAL